jgi:hypothetical protein
LLAELNFRSCRSREGTYPPVPSRIGLGRVSVTVSLLSLLLLWLRSHCRGVSSRGRGRRRKPPERACCALGLGDDDEQAWSGVPATAGSWPHALGGAAAAAPRLLGTSGRRLRPGAHAGQGEAGPVRGRQQLRRQGLERLRALPGPLRLVSHPGACVPVINLSIGRTALQVFSLLVLRSVSSILVELSWIPIPCSSDSSTPSSLTLSSIHSGFLALCFQPRFCFSFSFSFFLKKTVAAP